MRLSKFHLFLTFFALMLLRVVVGFHFFMEGADKVKNGFTAEYFLAAAKGPFADQFHSMLDDDSGDLKFCLTENSETGKAELNPELTFAIWDDFFDRAYGHYKFGDVDLEQKLVERRKTLGEEISKARENQDKSVNTRELEAQRAKDEKSILKLRKQLETGEAILQSHMEELQYWLDVNEIELMAYFGTQHRESGFDRDGDSKEEVAVYVDSLRDQVTTIKSDRKKQKGQWAAEIDAIWDSYETQINGLAVDAQAAKVPLTLHRPFKQKFSKLQWINRIIPWFDLVVGALLILGLFARVASLLGAGFLASVILTQPPWIPGTQPTFLYAIELVALLVIFATLAGRMGGLDFFLSQWGKKKQTESAAQPQPAAAATQA